jgi:CelD/BcsL family acetyltransferase involved in cellulose biosynthesis
LEQLDAAQAEWAELAARAIEPNAFFEPGFALAAARHFPLRSRPRFIVVWDGGVSGAKRMRGLFPIVTSSPLIGDGLIRLWLHKQTALATPLVDREDPQAVIAAFLDWIERRSFSNGVVFSRTAMNGPFQKALAAAARDRGRRVETLDSYERAALLRGHEADELCLRASSGKSLRRLYRMRRRLSKLGKVDFTISVEADEIRVATEEFLVLEASGWKAGRGALLSEAALSTFLRSSTRMLARERLCKIYALRLDGRPVAMGIVIESQGRSFWWKIAYDERFGAHMPGMQLAHEITKAQLARPEIELTDSCSQANHPMIERIWPDRLTVCDYAVQLQRDREIEFLKSCRISRRRASLRGLAKRATIALLRRKAR